MQRFNRFLMVTGGMLYLLVFGIWGQNSQKDRPPQSQIEEFYADYNFICFLSTREERARLAAHLDVGDLPPDITNLRMRAVFHRMRRILERIHVLDPEMVKPPRMPWNRLEHLYRADGYEVSQFRLTNDGAAVGVKVYHLEPEEIMHFIQEYEKTNEGDRQPDPGEWLASSGRAAVLTQEIHLWRPVGGKWKKLDSHFTFLEHKK
jgi:hypothetical protein